MFATIDQDRARLEQFLPWVPKTLSVQDSQSYIQSTLARWENSELFDYGLFTKAKSTYVGNVGVHTLDWVNECCEIGYWIAGAFSGQGLISEAVQMLTETAFEVGFHRVEIRCEPGNQKSANVPKLLGFLSEGCLRQNLKSANGKFRDTLVFARLNPRQGEQENV